MRMGIAMHTQGMLFLCTEGLHLIFCKPSSLCSYFVLAYCDAGVDGDLVQELQADLSVWRQEGLQLCCDWSCL